MTLQSDRCCALFLADIRHWAQFLADTLHWAQFLADTRRRTRLRRVALMTRDVMRRRRVMS